jgi:ABC-2 type transport system permease protein
MKSKTYFFNKAVLLKNLTLYWPIWVCYLLYGLVKVPGRLWFGLQKYGDESGATYQALADCLDLKMDIIVIAVFAVFCGMAVFGYLFSMRSAYMIHALPVTRSELFFTNTVSALGFLIVPQIFVFFVTVLLCLSNGIASVQYVGIWLLSVMGISFLMFSVVSFCAMLTGLLFALPAFFVLINYLSLGCTLGVRLLLSQLGYGISYNDTPDILLLRILSPIDYLFGEVSLSFDTGKGIIYSGGAVVAGYALAAFFIYGLAYLCYKKRKSESAGELLAFVRLGPVFRWLIGLGAGYTAAIIINSFVDGIPFILSLLVLGFIVFFVTEMFIEKSFRVITAGRFKEAVIFLGFTAATYGCVYGAAYGVEQYVPSGEQVENAYIYMNYPVEFEGSDIEAVRKIHEEILEHGNEIQRLVDSDEADEVMSVTLIYHYKNGKSLERLYQLPSGDDFCEELAKNIYSYETGADSFMKYLVGMDYESITDFDEAEVEIASEDEDYAGHVLTSELSQKVYKALCEDAKAGTIQKYNLSLFGEQEDSDMFLYLSFKHTSDDWEDVYDVANASVSSVDITAGATGDEGSAVGYLNVSFGEDCENIMQVLEAEGIL